MAVPLPNNNGLTFSYATVEMLNYIWQLGVIGMILFGIMVIMLLIRKFVTSDNKAKDGSEESRITLLQRQSRDPRLVQTKYDPVVFVASCLFYGLVIIGTLMLGLLYGFQKLGSSIGAKIGAAAYTLAFGIIMHLLWQYYLSENSKEFFESARKIRGHRLCFYIGLLVFWMAIVGMMFYMLHGVCVCYYNDKMGGLVHDYGISTTFTRSIFQNNRVCGLQKICKVYATLPSTTDSSVFINIHTGTKLQNLTVSLTTNNTVIRPTDMKSFKADIIEANGQRRVWTFLFDNLTADTVYNVEIHSFSDQQTYQYKTLGKFGDTTNSIKVVLGGDVGINKEGTEIFENMAKEQPDLLIIGGDVSYDNAMTYCYSPWDSLYDMISVLGANRRLVPFIFALGNHDVGWNSLAKLTLTPKESGPWWFAYHPQHFNNQNQRKIPEIKDRKAYFFHKIGSTALVTIDSGYLNDYQHQGQYLETTSANLSSQNYALMGLYHVPVYPSCFHPSHFQSPQALNLSRQHYESRFVKYKFKLCLQNHVHKFKRTKPIDNVTYIGDGAMGVQSEECPKADRLNNDLMAIVKYTDSNHYWVAQLWNNRAELTAKSRHNGTNIDNFKLPLV